MKNVTVVSVLTGLVALATLATCENKPPTLVGCPVNIPPGKRLKLKPLANPAEDPVTNFKRVLLNIPPDDRKGTDINLRHNNQTEEKGPVSMNQFVPVPASSQIGPNGSVHVTQSIKISNPSECQRVLDLLETGTPGSSSFAK